MSWIRTSDELPSADALIYADGAYHVAALVSGAGDPAFIDVHSSDLLPWPSHWMALPPPPG